MDGDVASTRTTGPASVAARRYRAGYLNRRMARRLENLNRAFADITGQAAECVLVCACGDAQCTATLTITLAEYEPVQRTAHRFVVAPGHAAEIDVLIACREGYDIVEIRPQYRRDASRQG